MAGKDKIPEIRFAGSTDAWEQRKLLDNVNKVIDFRGRTPKKLGLDWSENGYLALSALNVKNGYIDVTIDAHYGDQELYDAWMTGNELHQGQVLFTTEAPMGNVAQIPDNRRYILSQRTIAFEVDERIIAEDYLAIVLGSPNIFNRLTALSSGGTAKGVSQKSLSELTIPIPNSTEEQKKIGLLFKQLDHLITLHQRKYDKLVIVKKSLLKKMFPKDGANVPEIRFAGFTDAWEQRKVTELGKIFIGLVTTMTKNYREDGTLLIRNSDIKDNHFEFAEEPIFLDEQFAEDNSSRKLKIGDVVTVHTGDVGTSAVITENEEGAIGFATINTRPNKEIIDSNYLSTYFNSDLHKSFAITMSTGDGRTNYNLKDFFELVVPFPKLEEQKKISEYFKHLDHLITLYQRELEKLKNIKKSLLEKMFV